MKPSHELVPKNLIDAEHAGYRIRALPPFRHLRGLDIPWEDSVELRRTVEFVAKASRSRKVVKLNAGQFGTPVELFIKRYNFKSWLKFVLRAGRKSRAREEFDLGWELLAKGIQTPRPVWLAEAKGTVSRFSMLATEALPEADSVLKRWRGCSSERQRAALLTQIGRFTGRLHDAGFYHDDYRAGHLLMLPGRPADYDEFYLIDLLGGRFLPVLTPLRRARNLYQMLCSFLPKRTNGFPQEHRAVFLSAYCGSARRGAGLVPLGGPRGDD